MSKPFVVHSNKPEDLRFVEIIGGELGYPIEVCKSANHLADLILQTSPLAIFSESSPETEYRTLETVIQDKIGLFSEQIQSNRFHFFGDDGLDKFSHLLASPLIGNFIVRRNEMLEVAAKRYSRIVKAFMRDDLPFGLANFFTEGTKVQTVKLTHSSQKQDAVEAVRNFAIAAKFSTRASSFISNAVDEYIMNAIYDAPTDTLGRQTFVRVSRNTPIALDKRQEVSMSIAYDREILGVSVLDQYGSLDKSRLITQMLKNYKNESYKISSSREGAGIGLATVFKSSAGMVFLVEGNTRTEAIIFFAKTDNFKDFRSQFRFLTTYFQF